MSGPDTNHAGEDISARDDIARRDDRIAELERSQQRLQHLYDISKLLTRFQDFEWTIPEVADLIADTLPLRSAILILETDGATHTTTWQVPGEGVHRLHAAQARAQKTYGYLID